MYSQLDKNPGVYIRASPSTWVGLLSWTGILCIHALWTGIPSDIHHPAAGICVHFPCIPNFTSIPRILTNRRSSDASIYENQV